MRSHIAEVQLAEKDGRRVFVEVEQLGAQSDVAAKHPFQLGQALGAIREVTAGLRQLLSELAPQKASIEFGMQLGVESGALVAIVAKGTASANFKITLTWE